MFFKSLLKLDIDANRVFGLDILRAFAIMFVVLGHGNLLLPENVGHKIDFFLFDGVSIFFVLSGFLIGRILIRILEKDKLTLNSLYDFWTRRWLRTLPNYVFILILLAILNIIFVPSFKLLTIIPYFLFLQNISEFHLIFFTESWSLSVEEWFYLLVPTILFILVKLNLKRKLAILGVAVSLILAVFLFRYNRFITMPISNTREEWGALFYFPVLTRIDSIMFGLLGAFASINIRTIWLKYRTQFLFVGIGLFALDKLVFLYDSNYSGIYSCVFSFTVLSIATLMVLPYLAELKTGRGFIYIVITYISLISYSMYLVNNSLVNNWGINFFNSFLRYSGVNIEGQFLYVVKYLFFLIMTVLISIILYKYLELPFMRLRKKEH